LSENNKHCYKPFVARKEFHTGKFLKQNSVSLKL